MICFVIRWIPYKELDQVNKPNSVIIFLINIDQAGFIRVIKLVQLVQVVHLQVRGVQVVWVVRVVRVVHVVYGSR